MPYIKKEQRVKLNDPVRDLTVRFASPGDMNYIITKLLHHWIILHGLNYTTLNEAIGILECAKAELLRTVVGKYEAKKRLENGAISELDSIGLDEVR